MPTINAILIAEEKVEAARTMRARALTRQKILDDERSAKKADCDKARSEYGRLVCELQPEIETYDSKTKELREKIDALDLESKEFHSLMLKAESQYRKEKDTKLSKIIFEKAAAYKNKRDECNRQKESLRKELKSLRNPRKKLQKAEDNLRTAQLSYNYSSRIYREAEDLLAARTEELGKEATILFALLTEIGIPEKFHQDYKHKINSDGNMNFYFPANGENHGHIVINQNNEIVYCRLPKTTKSLLQKIKEWFSL